MCKAKIFFEFINFSLSVKLPSSFSNESLWKRSDIHVGSLHLAMLVSLNFVCQLRSNNIKWLQRTTAPNNPQWLVFQLVNQHSSPDLLFQGLCCSFHVLSYIPSSVQMKGGEKIPKSCRTWKGGKFLHMCLQIQEHRLFLKQSWNTSFMQGVNSKA